MSATVYAIKNLATGQFRYQGVWAEEPEWMTWSSAKNVAESSFITDPVEIIPYECTREDMGE